MVQRTKDFGELSVDLGCTTPAHVGAARLEQRRLAQEDRRVFLAELLMEKGAISPEQHHMILERGQGYGEGASEDPLPAFGDVAVRKGYVSAMQLYRALLAQRDASRHRPIGEVLVERGHLSPWELEDVLVTLADLGSGSSRTGETPSDAFPVGEELYGGGVLYARRYPSEPELDAPTATETARGAKVREFMSVGVRTSPDMRLGEVLDALAESDAQAALVLHGEELMGVIDAWDVKDVDRRTPIGRCMRIVPEATVSARASIRDAARIMRETGASVLAVLSCGAAVGIVTQDDLRRAGILPHELDDMPIAYEELGVGD